MTYHFEIQFDQLCLYQMRYPSFINNPPFAIEWFCFESGMVYYETRALLAVPTLVCWGPFLRRGATPNIAFRVMLLACLATASCNDEQVLQVW